MPALPQVIAPPVPGHPLAIRHPVRVGSIAV